MRNDPFEWTVISVDKRRWLNESTHSWI
jgi:hypothetical protein